MFDEHDISLLLEFGYAGTLGHASVASANTVTQCRSGLHLVKMKQAYCLNWALQEPQAVLDLPLIALSRSLDLECI